VSQWVYIPPWGIRAVAVVGMGLVGLSIFRLLRERRNVAIRRTAVPGLLRLAAIGVLLFVDLNPTALLPRDVEGKPSLVVLVDTSYSMSTTDADGRSRLGAALAVLQDEAIAKALEEEFTVDVRSFDKTTRAARLAALKEADASGAASDLGAALSEAVTDQASLEAQAGVLLVSDGRATSAGAMDAGHLALARSVPVWTWCLGGEVPRRDLWIEVPTSEALAFAGSEVGIKAILHQTGYENRSFRVEVLRGGKVIDACEVLPGPDGSAPITATVLAPEGGEDRILFRAVPDEGEADIHNNERAVFLRVVGDKVRVLVVEGQPHWDTKFLVQCLKRDEHVDLTAVSRLGPDRYFAVVSAMGEEKREERNLFPRTAEAMLKYDVIIFGRGCETFFEPGTEEHLTEFVARRGGGVVFARGRPYGGRFTALAKFEPIAWDDGVTSRVRLEPTAAGAESPVFEMGLSESIEDLLGRLPRLDQARTTIGEKPLAVVLARADGASGADGEKTIAMAYHRYGQGKVLTINSSGIWRWAFREKGAGEEAKVYGRFWMAVLRWMLAASDFLPGQEVALRSGRRYYTDEQPMEFFVSTRSIDTKAYSPELIIAGGGTTTQVEPREARGGGYVAQAGPFAPGPYTVTLMNNVGRPERLEMTVEVVSSSVEKRVLSSDPDLMARLSEISGGSSLGRSGVADMAGVVRKWRASRQKSMDKRSVWDRSWLLALLVAVMGLEWFLRRREGLL